jgi:hypothetical protein
MAEDFDSMAKGENGYEVSAPLLTIGETIDDYTPVGILDGLGAMELNGDTVRVFANHELLHFRGNEYTVNNGNLTMTGARVSFFDIDKDTREIVDAGLAYHTVYDAFGNVPTNTNFLGGLDGFSRFCSSILVEANQFAKGSGNGNGEKNGRARGLQNPIYFTGEEDGGFFNPVGGAEWALDVATGELWQVPAMGRGAWENITQIDTGNNKTVAFILADDSSPFDFDGDNEKEVAPLFLYVGTKDKKGDFLGRNGLRDGKLYVWVSDTGETLPSQFNTTGELDGSWVEIDNERRPELAQPDRKASDFDRTGYDENGYPTQGNLWLQAKKLGAFGFSRPEDVATNPDKPNAAVLASTGVDNFDIDPMTDNGVDTFGTMYVIETDFDTMTAELEIIYDGDADPSRSLRSPDNLDWGDDGYIYIQEDKAEDVTASGDEFLFGTRQEVDDVLTDCDPNGLSGPLCAQNGAEAGIVLMDEETGAVLRIASIDRSVVLDASIDDPTDAVDNDAGIAGEWESSGIVDVSTLFDEEPGTLFLFDVQAHGIDDQEDVNPSSRISDGDLVEGGQLLFLMAPEDD